VTGGVTDATRPCRYAAQGVHPTARGVYSAAG
jgi:hypothetical protein